MQPKNPLFQKCLAYLESLPNLRVDIQGEPYFSTEVLADGLLTIHTPHTTVHYVCEIKIGLTPDAVKPVVDYFSNLSKRLKPEQKPLLITRNLSNLVVDQLLEEKIEFVDVDGNVYLNSPDIYVVVRNQASKDREHRSSELTAAALQVIYALLKRPRVISARSSDFVDIAETVGVTPKTVGTTLKRLQELGYLTLEQKEYTIADYIKLLERWELGYVERLRPKVLLGTFSPINRKNFSDVEDELKDYADRGGYLIGGELAAAMITDHLRPVSATLHLGQKANDRQIAVQLKLKPDSEGNIALLQRFDDGNYKPDQFENFPVNLAHPLLIHAELVWTGNSRLKETAQLIYDRYIEDIAQEDVWY